MKPERESIKPDDEDEDGSKDIDTEDIVVAKAGAVAGFKHSAMRSHDGP